MPTILLVDDQPAVVDALKQCFALEADLEIVGDAGDGATAVVMAQVLHPDIVLTDIEMPRGDGIATTAALRTLEPGTKVIILTVHDDQVTRVRAFEAGAAAFVSKHDSIETLLDAIQGAAKT